MKTSNISRLILPTITCLLGIIISTLVSAFMYYFGDGPRKLGDFLIVFSPTIILLILLFVAWIYQLLGGTLLIVAGSIITISYILYSISTNSEYFVGALSIAFIIGIPIILSGILFRIIHFEKKSS